MLRHLSVRLWTMALIAAGAWLGAMGITALGTVVNFWAFNLAANLTIFLMVIMVPVLLAAVAIGKLDRINPFYPFWDELQRRRLMQRSH